MGLSASNFDRRVQFQRQITGDDGYGNTTIGWADHGSPIYAERLDVSDGERAVSGWLEATIVSRFSVRSTSFTRDLTPIDRLIHDGMEWDILGIKQAKGGRHMFLEITARARADV